MFLIPRHNTFLILRMVLCSVCYKNVSKYKCSTCFSPYCSVGCWNTHKKEKSCVAQNLNVNELLNDTDIRNYFTEDTIENSKLLRLRESKILQLMLKSKDLQDMLTTIDNAKNSEETLQRAMMNSNFVEFVDECLKVVQDEN